MVEMTKWREWRQMMTTVSSSQSCRFLSMTVHLLRVLRQPTTLQPHHLVFPELTPLSAPIILHPPLPNLTQSPKYPWALCILHSTLAQFPTLHLKSIHVLIWLIVTFPCRVIHSAPPPQIFTLLHWPSSSRASPTSLPFLTHPSRLLLPPRTNKRRRQEISSVFATCFHRHAKACAWSRRCAKCYARLRF